MTACWQCNYPQQDSDDCGVCVAAGLKYWRRAVPGYTGWVLATAVVIYIMAGSKHADGPPADKGTDDSRVQITQAVDVTVTTWTGTAATMRLVYTAYYVLLVDPASAALKVTKLLLQDVPPAWGPWAPWILRRPMVCCAIWGGVFIFLPLGLLPYLVLLASKKAAVSMAAAAGYAMIEGSGALKLSEALLTVPGWPPLRAVKVPLALSYITGLAAWWPAYYGVTWPLAAMAAFWMGVAVVSKGIVYFAATSKPPDIPTVSWIRHLVRPQAHPCKCHQDNSHEATACENPWRPHAYHTT